jgi:tetratricopeptide (TPR) repeat protein
VAKALDIGADRADRARRCLAMARDLLQLGDTAGALAASEQAIEEADDSTRAHALLLQARIKWLTGSSVTALAVAEEALTTVSDPLLEATIRTQAAFLSKGDRRRGLVHARRAVAILQGLTGEEASGALGRALGSIGSPGSGPRRLRVHRVRPRQVNAICRDRPGACARSGTGRRERP